ncbi:hypothetical protein [Acetohalobium arabaticum]|uniref:Uncharacterized protein n=1 Tax=Acetohalobium arabaticum (strain ATCC 49924 / DSM 5501 / Z-7288) TaxID=574087 RepID=D9QTK1_ACEAZ|nr:hypothetical protein [Acetohalobium arabaticum]ADL11765.1 conserved hypothetical protein [Acetohalobium arabaticum DSM 5501]
MKRIMLILFSFAKAEKVISRSFELLGEEDELYVAGFVDHKLPESLSDLISDVGFLGDKVTEDVESAVIAEYKKRAEGKLDLIIEQGEEYSGTVKAEMLSKDELADLKSRIEQGKADYLLINYTDDHFLAEEVLDYPLDEILARIDIPYEVYYDGELSRQQDEI